MRSTYCTRRYKWYFHASKDEQIPVHSGSENGRGQPARQLNSVTTFLIKRLAVPLREPSRLNMSPSAAAAATAHSFNKILNLPRTSSKSRSAADVEEAIKKLRRLILVDGIPSSVVCIVRLVTSFLI
jgi:hypothetical protein